MTKPVVVSPAREGAAVVSRIVARAKPPAVLEILEAGCGRAGAFALPGVRYRLTGVDLDAHALEARRTVARDLDVAVVGDLRSVELPDESFDVIVCAYVLEHVEGAERVLENFCRWLRPGGLLVVRVPNRDSAFGFVARHTPFWFHVAVWRYVYGSPEAGLAGHAPYPTSYDPVLGVEAMRRFCTERSLRLVDVLGHSTFDRPGLRIGAVAFFLRGLELLSGGSLAADHNNLTFLVEKAPPARAAALGSQTAPSADLP